ncbi:MAG: glycosyltransferase [Phycisphaerales bacterium]|nr:MAG: glycosyltransferase [Phycisphaerales bacterium]
MKIGVIETGWWKRACEALSHQVVDLPTPSSEDGNAYTADLESRSLNGRSLVDVLSQDPVDLLLDNGAAGLNFVRSPKAGADVDLAHEAAGHILCSHFIDPLAAVFQKLPWALVWPCLNAGSWIKAVWDRAIAQELGRFGVPSVVHLPMAAPNRSYNTEPLDARNTKQIVSFVGGQNTTYFASDKTVPAKELLSGVLAQVVHGDIPEVTYYDVYYDMYGLAEPPRPDDDLETQVRKTAAYLNTKVFYNASLCVRNRDRFVIFLRRKLGNVFHLYGRNWDKAYGLSVHPSFPTTDEYLQHFREAAINLNLVNGNAETGLNMRHFEITAAGGFMLCYDQPELADHFEIGKECAVFHNEIDLLDKIDHYLNHPEERTAIALAGQRRTLSQHLYSHRLQTLLDILTGAGALQEQNAATQMSNTAPPFAKSASHNPVSLDVTAGLPGR